MSNVTDLWLSGVFFQALRASKYSRTRFPTGALPQTPLGELMALPQTP